MPDRERGAVMSGDQSIGGDPFGIREGFVKRRRSLIVLTVVLFLHHFGGLTVKSFPAGGLEVSMPDQFVLATVLWVSWFYFFVTCAQYHIDLKDRQFRETVDREFRRRAESFAEKEFEERIRSGEIPANIPREGIIKRVTPEVGPLEEIEGPGGAPSWTVVVRGSVTYLAGKTPVNQIIGKTEIEIDQGRGMSIRAEARRSTLIRTRYLGEYIMPYVIASILFASAVIDYVIDLLWGG